MKNQLKRTYNEITALPDPDREYGLDILKILSCLAVVGLHTFSRTGEPAFQVCFLCCGFAIPSFITVNGYLILRKNIDSHKLERKILKYIFIAFAWTSLYSITLLVVKKNRGGGGKPV